MTTQSPAWPRLSSLGLLSKVGLIFLVLTLLTGYIVSGIFLNMEYENRDERPGLTMTDIVGAYHGVVSPSPLLESLKSGHPETLASEERTALISWLEGDRIGEDYDNFDLGDMAPAEIIAVNCLNCHTRGATEGDGIGDEVPLGYFSDIQPIAVSREINPKNERIIALSMHVHAPSLSMVLIMLTLLGAMTRWPGLLVGGIAAVAGVGLFFDITGQWLARFQAFWAYAIVVGGFLSSAGVGLLGLLVMAEMLLPGKKANQEAQAL
ncbi:MAG: hypothetical protein ACIARQ_17245 [Phycisphaerales bacterium JB061]